MSISGTRSDAYAESNASKHYSIHYGDFGVKVVGQNQIQAEKNKTEYQKEYVPT